jgi:tRNA C32,U32 (ribose-2'-O)-methylase TrmJ
MICNEADYLQAHLTVIEGKSRGSAHWSLCSRLRWRVMPEKELAKLLQELEETLLTLKATEDPERRRMLLRKMRRLFAEIELNQIAPR